MTAGQLADRRKLARFAMARRAPALDLISAAVLADGVDIRHRVTGQRPAECLAKEVFGKLAGRTICASRYSTLAQFLGDSSVELQELR